MVLKELIFNSFYFQGESVVVVKELIFNSFLSRGGCGGLKRTNF